MENLFTPWRYAYITKGAPASECFFCDAARSLGTDGSDALGSDTLVLHAARHHLVMLNLHPYSSGHLMVAPLEHLASPAESGPAARRRILAARPEVSGRAPAGL